MRQDPVEWFLFDSREGHCEFFASSMVLLLRTVGIPARLQAGYIGGEREGDGAYLVRESNAHAWVLAYVEKRWRVFDPTPPEGRPGLLAAGEALSLREAWDRFESAVGPLGADVLAVRPARHRERGGRGAGARGEAGVADRRRGRRRGARLAPLAGAGGPTASRLATGAPRGSRSRCAA